MSKRDMNIILLGSGGHASVLVDALALLNLKPTCIADDARARGVTDFFGLECIGNDDDILNRDPEKIILVNGIGSTSRPRNRASVFHKFKDRGYHFLSIIHPSAQIGSGVTIGEGVQVMAGAVVQAMAVLEGNVILNTRCSVDHHTLIGESAHIAPGATICGDVQIGPVCMIGAGATVIQGVKIGASCLVGAGVTVKADMAASAVKV